MSVEMIFDDRLDPSQIIRSQTDRRVRNDGAYPEYARISFDGGRTTHKVPAKLLGSFKKRGQPRRRAEHSLTKKVSDS